MAMPYFCCERKGSRQIDVDNAAISSALDLCHEHCRSKRHAQLYER